MTETVREGRDRGRVFLESPYREVIRRVSGECLLPSLPSLPFFKGFLPRRMAELNLFFRGKGGKEKRNVD